MRRKRRNLGDACAKSASVTANITYGGYPLFSKQSAVTRKARSRDTMFSFSVKEKTSLNTEHVLFVFWWDVKLSM